MALKPLNSLQRPAPATELAPQQGLVAAPVKENALEKASDEEVKKVYDLAIDGDLSRLTTKEKILYLTTISEKLGLNPLTRPFGLIKLDGKVTLYALKECAAQLSRRDSVSVAVSDIKIFPDLGVAEVSVRASTPDGRFTDEVAAIAWGAKLIGENAANARMKLVTKGKRRAILSHCGLGVIDESELDTVRNVERVEVNEEKRIEQAPKKPEKPKESPVQGGRLDTSTESTQGADDGNDAGTKQPEPAVIDVAVTDAEEEKPNIAGDAGNADNSGPFNYDSTEDRQWLISLVKSSFPRILRSDVINLCGTFAKETKKEIVIMAINARVKHETKMKEQGKPSLIP